MLTIKLILIHRTSYKNLWQKIVNGVYKIENENVVSSACYRLTTVRSVAARRQGSGAVPLQHCPLLVGCYTQATSLIPPKKPLALLSWHIQVKSKSKLALNPSILYLECLSLWFIYAMWDWGAPGCAHLPVSAYFLLHGTAWALLSNHRLLVSRQLISDW